MLPEVIHQIPGGRWILAAWTLYSNEWFALPVADDPELALRAPTLEALAAMEGVETFDRRADAERAAKRLEDLPDQRAPSSDERAPRATPIR